MGGYTLFRNFKFFNEKSAEKTENRPLLPIKPTVFLVLIFCLGLLFPIGVFGQESTNLKGKITNVGLEDSYLHVMNLNLQKGTITTESGTFSIPARVGDTLYVSALQFANQKIVVTQSIFDANYIEITLKEDVEELAAVTVKDIALSGRLGEDLNTVAVIPYFDQTDVGFAPTAPKRSSELRQLQGAGGIGLGGLIDMMSGRKKMLKKIYKISIMEGRVKTAQTCLKTAIYTDILKIPEMLVDDFCYFVYENNEEALSFAAKANVLQLIDFLRSKAVYYIEFKAESPKN